MDYVFGTFIKLNSVQVFLNIFLVIMCSMYVCSTSTDKTCKNPFDSHTLSLIRDLASGYSKSEEVNRSLSLR